MKFIWFFPIFFFRFDSVFVFGFSFSLVTCDSGELWVVSVPCLARNIISMTNVAKSDTTIFFSSSTTYNFGWPGRVGPCLGSTVTNFLAIGSASCINVRSCFEYHRNRIPMRTHTTHTHTDIRSQWNWKKRDQKNMRDQRNLSASHILLCTTTIGDIPCILHFAVHMSWLGVCVCMCGLSERLFFSLSSYFFFVIPHPRGHHTQQPTIILPKSLEF